MEVRILEYHPRFGAVPPQSCRAVSMAWSAGWRRCRFFGGRLCRAPLPAPSQALLLSLPGLLPAIGIAINDDELGVVDEAVDQGDEAGGVPEGFAPLGQRAVGVDCGGALARAAGNDTEQQISMAIAEAGNPTS